MLLTDVTDFDIGTTLPQGMRGDHTGRFISSLKFPKIVFSTDFENYEKGEVFRDTFHQLFGTGIFNADGMSSHPTPSSDA